MLAATQASWPQLTGRGSRRPEDQRNLKRALQGRLHPCSSENHGTKVGIRWERQQGKRAKACAFKSSLMVEEWSYSETLGVAAVVLGRAPARRRGRGRSAWSS